MAATSETRSRVVPGMSVTMARSCASSRLNRKLHSEALANSTNNGTSPKMALKVVYTVSIKTSAHSSSAKKSMSEC